MAKPFTVNKSRFKLPVAMTNPMAVTWNNATLVWSVNNESLRDVVFINTSGKWIMEVTRGDVPGDMYYSDYTAQVIKNKMYLHVLQYIDYRAIFTLDLNTWTWTKINPGGTTPFTWGGGLYSWVYMGKMYNLLRRSELVCYNIPKNTWEWPTTGGETPSLDSLQHSTIIDDDTVFLLGSIKRYNSNSLYILDMVTMMWTKVHGNISTQAAPYMTCSRTSQTLTKMSQYSAILFGESGNSMVCWLLNLQNAKQLMDPASIWTKISLHLPVRGNYAAVLEPKGEELWIIGGYHMDLDMDIGSITNNVLKIPTRLPSLKSLVLDSLARITCTNDPRLVLDQFPAQLRNEIEVCKQEIVGGESLCTQEKGCAKCWMPVVLNSWHLTAIE